MGKQMADHIVGKHRLIADWRPHRLPLWLASLALLTCFFLGLTSARVKSATFDEDASLGRGTAIWMEGNYDLEMAHPPLGPMISTLPLLTEPTLAPPVDHRCWPDGTARSCGRELLFQRGTTQRVLFLARLPTMFLTAILATLVYRWTLALAGSKAALIGLTLCAFDPNILAHGRLATLDLVATLVIFLSCFLFWAFWNRPSLGRWALLGAALGIAGATHFVTGVLVPFFIVLSLVRAWHPLSEGGIPGLRSQSRWRRLAVTVGLLLMAGVSAGLVIWAVHSFRVGPVARWQDIRLPAPAYFSELAVRLGEKPGAPNSFLLGRHYEGGWWPYFLVAWFVKTPWPTILLTALGMIRSLARRDLTLVNTILLAVPGVYFVLASLSDFNRGYRYILPVLPFAFVLAGRAGAAFVSVTGARGRWRHLGLAAALVWLLAANGLIYPHYLAYFNELVRPQNGYKVLVDSNLDWGQDLPALEAYVAQHDLDSIYLSWFGESRPAQYDIPHRFIPSKPDELSDVHTRVYHPDYPPPGSYAISATNLQGLLFEDKNLFEFFLAREPEDQPGYSILTYEVPRLLDREAPTVNVVLGGCQIDQVPTTVFEDLWRTNDVRLRWFETESSCILPSETDVWYVLGGTETRVNPPCPLWLEAEEIRQVSARKGDLNLRIYRLRVGEAARRVWAREQSRRSAVIISDEIAFVPGDAPDRRTRLLPPVRIGERLDMIGYELGDGEQHPGQLFLQVGHPWKLLTSWRVRTSSETPLKVFVQLLDDAGNPRTQYDGLDVPTIGWREQDIVVQEHTLSIPEDLDPGRYWVQFGLYNAWNGERLPVLVNGERVGSRLLLPSFTVDGS